MIIARPRAQRTTVAALATVVALSLAGCSASTGDTASSDNTLIVALTASDVPNLDTGLAQIQGYEGLRFVSNQLYDGLTRFDLDQGDTPPSVEPDLAESWTSNDELTVWDFTLRDGVTFHDGTPWNADAAIYNLERYVDTGTDHFYADLAAQASFSIGAIASFEKIDDLTIRITTSSPLAILPENLATVYFGSPTALEELGNDGFALAPVGTGPFVFEKLTPGQSAEFSANEDYWDGAPELDTLVLRPIPDATARAAALQSGEVNWIESPTPDDVPALTSAGFTLETNSYDHTWFWILDEENGPTADVRVREALNWAIDRDSLVTNVLHDTAEAAGGVLPRANPAYNEETDNVFGYDPERAVELLADAGYADGFEMTVSYPTGGSGMMSPGPMNTAIQADLAKVGVTVNLEPIDFAAMMASMFAKEFPGGADAVNMSGSYLPETFWGVWFNPATSPINIGGFSSPEVDELLAKAMTIADSDERAAVYAEAAAVIQPIVPWLSVVNDLNARVLAPSVSGFVEPKSWFVDLTTVSVG